ncbi:MAG: hypothetical protein ACLR3C_00770 [Eggerthella lenta]
MPVNDRAYLQRYAQAGGEEFYLGFHDDAWRDRFGEAADLNRMTGFGRTANPYTFDEALAIVEEVRALGKRAYVTFNANAYAQEQLDFLFGYFERLRGRAPASSCRCPRRFRPPPTAGLPWWPPRCAACTTPTSPASTGGSAARASSSRAT